MKRLSRNDSRRSSTARYAMAVGGVVLASTSTLVMRPWLGSSMSLFFFPAVVFTAMYGGHGPALVATVLSTLSLAFFFVQPYNSFDIGADDAIRLAVFAARRDRDGVGQRRAEARRGCAAPRTSTSCRAHSTRSER